MKIFKKFRLFLLSVLTIQISADVCDLCQCGPNIDGDLRIECMGGTKNNIPLELENIQWPTGDRNVEAFFQYLNYTYLPKVLGSRTVTKIVLDSNQIDAISTDPFQYFPNITSISIRRNSIRGLPKDFLKSTKKLNSLRLSNNFLSDIDTHALLHLQNLSVLDLSFNRLTTLPKEITELESLEYLFLDGNSIFVVENIDDSSTQSNIKYLNLAKNKFTMISSTSFKNFQQIERLRLSENEITNIEQEAFKTLTHLTNLYLSHNRLEELTLHLPDSLWELDLSFNHLRSWPAHNMPVNLQRLHIGYNNLMSLWNVKQSSENLRFLNATHNAIEQLPNDCALFELITLDLSTNYFNHVPKDLGDAAPKLQTLILDENPIENIEFIGQSPVALRKLSFRHMPLLQTIGRYAFDNVDIQEENSCVDLTIADCPMLERIDQHAFNGLPLCKLDLSNNNLTTLPANLTDWTSIKDGINLQDNPFVCNCTTQWMLDKVLNYLYKTKINQKYLMDLRCDKPYPFSGHRFIKYFRRKAAFCRPSEAMTMKLDNTSSMDNDDNSDTIFGNQFPEILRGESGIVIIVLTCVIMLAILIGVCLLLIRKHRRSQHRKNRRYPLY